MDDIWNDYVWRTVPIIIKSLKHVLEPIVSVIFLINKNLHLQQLLGILKVDLGNKVSVGLLNRPEH